MYVFVEVYKYFDVETPFWLTFEVRALLPWSDPSKGETGVAYTIVYQSA